MAISGPKNPVGPTKVSADFQQQVKWSTAKDSQGGAKITAAEARGIKDTELLDIAQSSDPLQKMMTYASANEKLAGKLAGPNAKKELDASMSDGFMIAQQANTRIAKTKAGALEKYMKQNAGKLDYPLNAFKSAKVGDSTSDRSYVSVDLDSSKLKKGDLLKAPDGTPYPSRKVMAAFEKLVAENPKLRLPPSQFVALTVDGKLYAP